jgi:hypothetical protein
MQNGGPNRDERVLAMAYIAAKSGTVTGDTRWKTAIHGNTVMPPIKSALPGRCCDGALAGEIATVLDNGKAPKCAVITASQTASAKGAAATLPTPAKGVVRWWGDEKASERHEAVYPVPDPQNSRRERARRDSVHVFSSSCQPAESEHRPCPSSMSAQ